MGTEEWRITVSARTYRESLLGSQLMGGCAAWTAGGMTTDQFRAESANHLHSCANLQVHSSLVAGVLQCSRGWMRTCRTREGLALTTSGDSSVFYTHSFGARVPRGMPQTRLSADVDSAATCALLGWCEVNLVWAGY